MRTPGRGLLFVALVAMLAASLRMVPFLWARALTPPGWTFTGNLTNSVDYMQYRVWFQQTQVEGPIVTNVFTSEPNRSHLVVLYHYVFGLIGNWVSLPPEYVYAYAGAVLAVALVAVLWFTVRLFLPDRYQAWWVFLALLVGGGFGAHLKFLTRFDATKENLAIRRLVFEPLQEWIVFEDRRGHYLFTTLFDTHFLLFWVVAVACMASMYSAIRDCRWPRLFVTGALCGTMTVLHLYEGVTLLVVATVVAVFCWIKGVSRRESLTVVATVAPVVVLCLGWQAWLVLRAGIPAPDWSEQSVLVSLLFLAYPLSWILVLKGLPRVWSTPSLENLFLLGWASGCTLLTLSGPFNPYTTRGTLTLMIPIGILAGREYFRGRSRVSGRAALVAMLVLAPTPLWYLAQMVSNTRFVPDRPAIYLDTAHRDLADVLRKVSTRDDVMLAEAPSLLWLAPAYQGRHYCGHFFLTVDYERKRREVARFFDSTPDAMRDFLLKQGIHLVFADPGRAPALSAVTGVRPLFTNSAGTLYAFEQRASGAGL